MAWTSAQQASSALVQPMCHRTSTVTYPGLNLAGTSVPPSGPLAHICCSICLLRVKRHHEAADLRGDRSEFIWLEGLN